MDSAIAPHLRCPRTRTRRIEDDFQPPFPAWSARGSHSQTRAVVGVFGVQSRGLQRRALAMTVLRRMLSHLCEPDGPQHYDLAHELDAEGFDNHVLIAYWTNPAAFARWQTSEVVRGWWTSDARLGENLGYFREILCPAMTHFETLFSTQGPMEGAGASMGELSDVVQEHGYWGAMRDRIPQAQHDALLSTGSRTFILHSAEQGQRVRVAGHSNVAWIRSGQDWSATEGQERRLYLDEVEPALCEGMDFLTQQGASVGCYSNRYMRQMNSEGEVQEKSFGLSFWRSLSDMERWAESHPTHVSIFGGFMRYVQALNFDLKLRLHHEVAVLAPEDQLYEYINCHPRTGLMTGLMTGLRVCQAS